MRDDATCSRVTSAIRQIGPLLHQAQALALSDAASRCQGIDRASAARSLMVRACMRTALSAVALPDGWRVEGSPSQMEQLFVVGEGLRLRYLREKASVFPGGVPAAGLNHARRAYWRGEQGALLTRQDGGGADENLLLLWGSDDTHTESGFTLRVVRTVGEGRYRGRTPIDLSLPVYPEAGMEFERFDTDQGDVNLFAEIEEFPYEARHA